MRTRRAPIYHGWILLAALMVTEPISWGILYDALPVFLKPIQADLGWSSSQLTGGFSLSLLVGGLAGIPIGRWLDRHGSRGVMTTGSIAAALLVLAWSQVHSLLGFYGIWAGMGVASAMVLYEPAFVAIANWFSNYRPRALMGLTFAAGWSTVIFVPLASWLVERHGWRSALVILAALLGGMTIPLHVLALRRRPEDLGLVVDGGARTSHSRRATRVTMVSGISLRTAIAGTRFWWLATGFFLALVTNVAIGIHLIPLLTERGFSASFAAFAAAAIGLVTLPGRLVFLPLGERIDLRFVTATIFGLQTIALLILLTNHSRRSVWLFVVLFGVGLGAVSASRAALTADLYGPTAYGAINGALAFITTIARAAGPLGGSLVHDHFGGYRVLLMLLMGCSAGAAVAMLQVKSARESLAVPPGAS